MNKKFSTLMALALLAGSFPVVAQTEAELVRVTPDQLVNGAEYVIHSLDNKSVMVTGKAYAGEKSTASGPVFAAPKADPDSVWTLALSKGKFTLTPKSNADFPSEIFKIYKWNSTNVLYTNTNGNVVNFELNDDGTLSAGDDFVKVYGEGGTTGFTVGAKEDAQKFAFYIKKNAVSSEDIPATSKKYSESQENMAFYILDDDGKYIGLAASQTKAINTSTLVSKDFDEFKTIEDKEPYTWYVTEDGAIKNVYYDKYLTIKSSKITVQDTPVEASISNYILSSASTKTVVGAVVTAETQLPSALRNGFWRVDFEKNDNGEYSIDAPNGIVLYAGEQSKVVNKEGGITEGYSSDDESLKMIWTLDAVETTTKGSYELRLKNKDNKYLSVDGEYVTVYGVNWNEKEYTFASNSGIILLKAGDQYVYVDANNELHLGLIAQATEFGLGNIQTATITAGELLGRFGDHFTLGITYLDEDTEKDVDVTGTFEGNLRPCRVWYNAGQITYDYENIKSERSFMLVNENGKIIGVDLTDPLYGEGNKEHGYSLIEISASDYVKSLSDPNFEHEYAVWFLMEYTPGQLEEKVQVINKIYLDRYESGNTFQIGLEKQGQNLVLVADEPSELLSTPEIEIELNAGSKIVDAKTWLTKPAYYTVEVLNKSKLTTLHYGKVLGLGETNGNVDWVAPENVDLTKPEGQFAIDHETYKFTNRVNKKTKGDVINSDAFYKIDDTTFASVYDYNGRTYIDTLAIKPITTFESYDGFKRFTAAELNANTYTIAMKNLSGDLNIVENHNDKHRLGLDADEKNATEWRIEMPWVTVKDVVNDVVDVRPDTMTVETSITYYLASANKWVTTSLDPKAKLSQDLVYAPKTALKICTYVLKNTDNGEYLYGVNTTESAGNAYYVCNPEREEYGYTIQEATRIAFKEVGDETVNLVPVYNDYNYDWTLIDDEYPVVSELNYENYAGSFGFDNTKIIAGASTESGVLKDEYLYKATDNDLFVINVAEAPTYKKMEQGEKVIISLKKDAESVLVEGPIGSLATISNREAHKDLNPTLYVDTAYVNRVGNYAYQYLLGVDITRIDTTYQCNLPEEHGVHRADTTYGRFLVNMIDSAKACTDVHTNPFVYNGEYKLDFVDAYHTNDTLFFTNKAGEVTSKMEVGNGDFNIAKYAFKMIDEDENEFVIETAAGYSEKLNLVIDNNGNRHWTVASVKSVPGYLRWVNGNLVVTSNIDEAAHFTMEASDKEATANETIAAGNVVVAGTNGAVVVKGAEGKNVIVSTILGKVVANEVVSSDNAQITAPAGIVVVSVDGESFKVVVK